MELWDQDYVDAEVPAYIAIKARGGGEFHFGYVHGFFGSYDIAEDVEQTRVTFWRGMTNTTKFTAAAPPAPAPTAPSAARSRSPTATARRSKPSGRRVGFTS